MKVGVLLPTFRRSPRAAFDAARDAVTEGLDGVFAYDHVWPMGSPDRPALAPFEVLAAVAVRQPGLCVGPLVARIGLVDDEVLLSQLRALRVAAGGQQLIAGLGTGDQKSTDENVAYGAPLIPAAQRRASLLALASALTAEGTEVWIGDGAASTRAIAADVGCTLNLWDRDVDEVRRMAAVSRVSWAGPAPSRDGAMDEGATSRLLEGLAAAGATWAVFAPQAPIATLARLRG